MTDIAFDNVADFIPVFKSQLIALPAELKKQTYDIRIKSGQPLTICARAGIFFLCGNGQPTKDSKKDIIKCSDEIMKTLMLQLCSFSVFSHESEIRQGYITLQQSYRVGICGTAVLENGQVKNIRDINSLVFRIPREASGCANPVFTQNIDLSKGILVAGEPSSGKTTFLRDLIKSLSFGKYLSAKRVAVLDERCEIESIYDLGPCADVFKAYPKTIGFSMALRAMSPEIIVCDELSPEDQKNINKALYCGIPVIASIHSSENELLQKKYILQLLNTGAFGNVIFLQGRGKPGQVKRIVKAGELLEGLGNSDDYCQQSFAGIDTGTKTEKQKIGAA